MDENKGGKKLELSPELVVAIRENIRKFIAVPGIITALVMFAIGFFVNDVAKEKAYKEAYLESISEIHELTKETVEMKANLKFSIEDSEKEFKDKEEEIEKILEETEKLRAQMDASTDWLKNIQETEERMANYLAANSGFMDKVANKYQTEINNRVDELLERLKLPVGSVIASMIPPHEFLKAKYGNLWLPADGRVVQEDSKYYELTGECKLPDLRGMFLRGLNEFEKDIKRLDGMQDPDGDGRNAGDFQLDQFMKHDHGKTMMKWQDIPDTDPEKIGPVRDNGGQGQDPAHWNPRYVEGRSRGESETRPKNIAVYWYIKIN